MNVENFIGRLLDRDYKVVDKSLRVPFGNETRSEKLMRFPIEKARLRSIWYFMGINITAMIGYGWSLKAQTVSKHPINTTILFNTHSI